MKTGLMSTSTISVKPSTKIIKSGLSLTKVISLIRLESWDCISWTNEGLRGADPGEPCLERILSSSSTRSLGKCIPS